MYKIYDNYILLINFERLRLLWIMMLNITLMLNCTFKTEFTFGNKIEGWIYTFLFTHWTAKSY